MTPAPPPAGPSVPADDTNALPVGTRLDEFELRGVLGVGGFGIVYLAFDHALEREVAVKEYMPASLAGRTETLQVSLRSKSDADSFQLGLKSFINEAKMLARFDHPALLKVHRFWQANGTAYMAMPVLRGHTLKDLRSRMSAPPDEPWLRSLLEPLLGAIQTLHAQEVYHRDIAPDNIHIDAEGRPVLLDFGAARRVLSDRTQTLTAILKPAYAPIEQYAEAGAVRQGPWTDLYALGATLHYLLLGHPPAPATARTVHDEASELTVERLPQCSDPFLGIIDWMLSPRPADRPQHVGQVLDALAGRLEPPPRRIPQTHTQWDRTVVLPHDLRPAETALGPGLASAAGAIAAPPAAPMRTDLPLDDDEPTRVLAPAAAATAAATAAEESAGSRVVPAGQGALPAAVLAAPQASSVAAPQVSPEPAAETLTPPHNPSRTPSNTPAASRRAWPLALLGIVAVAGATAAALWWPGGEAGTPTAQDGPVPPAAIAPLVGPPPEPAAPPVEAASAALPAPPMVAESTITTVVIPARPAPAASPSPRPPATPRPQPTADGGLPDVARQASGPALAAPEPAPRVEPAPEPRPVVPERPPAPPKPLGPEAQCAGSNFLTRLVCMERQCLQSANQSHPDCLAWRKDAKRD